jgi:integrase
MKDGSEQKRTLSTHDDELAAQRVARAWNEKASSGVAVAVTFADWLDQWLLRREKDGSARREKVRGIDAEHSIARRHLYPSPLAQKAVQHITRADIEDFAMWLRKRRKVDTVRTQTGANLIERAECISTQTQRHAMRLARQCLAEAVGRLIDVNPADEVSVSRGRKVDLSDDWLRADEIQTLLKCPAIPLRDRTFFACALGLGLRLNDLKLLEVANVHLDVEVPGPHVLAFVQKSEQAHKVPVLPWLAPWLRAHLATLPEGSRWLFPMPSGTHYSKSHDFGWAGRLERDRGDKVTMSVLKRAGIARKIRFHDLRGSTATHLALGTWGRAWTLNEVQQFLAHSDQRVTERYVRRANDVLAIAARETLGGGFVSDGLPPILPPKNHESPTDPARFERATLGSGGRCSIQLS